ncbi:MAG: OsmC family protein [Candidatus Sulfotelmatobacter sp.]
MITAKAIWTDNERYLGEASSHHAIVMDTASEKTASTPMELVLIALCGCTASDVVGILRKKREPFTSLDVSASAERASGYPAVYTEINLVYRIAGKVSRKAAEDAARLSKEKYCSVSAMLEKTARITVKIELVD